VKGHYFIKILLFSDLPDAFLLFLKKDLKFNYTIFIKTNCPKSKRIHTLKNTGIHVILPRKFVKSLLKANGTKGTITRRPQWSLR